MQPLIPTTMKTIIKSLTAGILAGMASITLCGTARADLAAQIPTAYPSGGTTWATDPGGHSPFYSSANISVSGNFSGVSQQAVAVGAPASVLAETITVTNFAGTNGISTVVANTNYVLTGISLLFSGADALHAYTLHIFDVTTNLSSNNGTWLTGSGATYGFTANGDLLGGGSGLSFTNQYLSGAEQQDYFGLQNGPASQDQIVLGQGHTYAIEVWFPSGSSSFFAQKCSAAPQDAGGELMASPDSRYTHTRITGSSSGFYGSSQHTWAIALYGYSTNVALTMNTNLVASTNYIIDQFNSFGYGATNLYVGTNNYSTGGLIYVWTNWNGYGTAWVTNEWNSTSDANGNSPNSGSLKITANFNSGGQYAVFDGFYGIKPPLSCYSNGIASFQCDLRFDPSSATTVNSGTFVTNYGHLQIGMSVNGTGPGDFWTSVEIPVGTTNWVHETIPLSLASDPNLFTINDVVFKIDGGWYSSHPLNGTNILWVDNVKFVGPATFTLPPPPVLSIQKAVPGLRMFAGSTANTYDRVELATIDQSQSWIGGSYPKSYSFTLLDYPANINQTMIFLVPVNTSGQANMGNVSGSVNEYIEFQATNAFWLNIQPYGTGGATASIEWKTNLANANPNQIQVVLTNSTAVGTWTLTFNSASQGTVTAPGGMQGAFTITNGTVATDFANPLVAYFGLQPNTSAGIGQYEDWASISVSGVAGVNENDNFTTDTSFNSGLWNINTLTVALNTCVQLVTTNTPYWVSWTLPAVNYDLGTATNVLASVTLNAPNGWMLPWYYNGYYAPTEGQQGNNTWVLLPANCLPTVDGLPGGVPTPNAFFLLFNPPLAN